MRRASSPQKTRALRLKEPLGVCTDRFCRIGRAKLHNAAGISAYTTHQHDRPRFHTAWTNSGHRTAPHALLETIRIELIAGSRGGGLDSPGLISKVT